MGNILLLPFHERILYRFFDSPIFRTSETPCFSVFKSSKRRIRATIDAVSSRIAEQPKIGRSETRRIDKRKKPDANTPGFLVSTGLNASLAADRFAGRDLLIFMLGRGSCEDIMKVANYVDSVKTILAICRERYRFFIIPVVLLRVAPLRVVIVNILPQYAQRNNEEPGIANL